jgi:uncharacterized protein (DUF1684 family)
MISQMDMQRISFLFVLLVTSSIPFAQQKDPYVESIKAYQKKYTAEHEVVKGSDKKYFRFYPIDKTYSVTCSFEKFTDTTGFTMKTSANTLQHYYKYGKLNFNLSGMDCFLFVYQSKELMNTKKYKDYLFVPFTDATTGDESYGSGRYLEFYIPEIKNNTFQLDFNKAYNPYCAYAKGFHCPIPPKENNLPIAVKAGEKLFGKTH